MISIRDEDHERLRKALKQLTRTDIISREKILAAIPEIEAVLKSIDELSKPAPYREPAALNLPKCEECLTRTVTDGHDVCSVCYVKTQKSPSK